jgi:hypothetical protein
MAATSSQPFADLIEKTRFRPGSFSPSSALSGIGTGLGTASLTPASPGTIPQVSGQLGSFMTPEFEAIKNIEDKDMRNIAMMEYIADRRAQKDIANLPESIKAIHDLQYEAKVKRRPLDFQDAMAMKALDAITSVGDIPRRIAAIRQMYGPETINAYKLPVEALNQGPRVRYFS